MNNIPFDCIWKQRQISDLVHRSIALSNGMFKSDTNIMYYNRVHRHVVIVLSSNSVPTHFSKLHPENWIFSSNCFILNNYVQLPILLLQFYDH